MAYFFRMRSDLQFRKRHKISTPDGLHVSVHAVFLITVTGARATKNSLTTHLQMHPQSHDCSLHNSAQSVVQCTGGGGGGGLYVYDVERK
jgi:hypothetical protein